MENPPKVTILIPVFNGESYLKECLEGALSQTFTDFECLVIDDGSSDGSVAVVKSFTDPRIRLVENNYNLGGATTRNKGFDLALGEYVVFMDCDDISVPDRIEKQVAFMDANREIGICGGFMQTMTADSRPMDAIWQCPTESDAIARYLAVDCTLFNPTLITRRSVVIENALYHDPAYTVADDMDWYVRMAKITKLANLPEVFVFYRRHDQQETYRSRFISRRNTINLHLSLMLEEIKRLRPYVQVEITAVSLEMTELVFLRNLVLIDQLIDNWIVSEAGPAEEYEVRNTLEKHLKLMWWDVASCLPRYSPAILRIVKQSAFFKSLPVTVRWGVWCKCIAGALLSGKAGKVRNL